MDGESTAPAPNRRQRVFWTVGVVCALLVAGVWGTFAAFTATTTNTGNSVSSGTVKVDQHAGSTSLYNAAGKKPGEDTVGCVKVTYSGSLPAMMRLYRSAASITNGSAFNLKVERGNGPTSPDASMNCVGFSAASTIYNGPLSGFPTTYGTGFEGRQGGGSWSQNRSIGYRFTITPNDDAAANNHTAVQSTSPHDFTWEARNFSGYPASVLSTSGLLSYWRLGEASGTTAFDMTSSGNISGTYIGGPTLGRPSLTSDAGDTAVSFDGVDDYVSFGDNYDFTGTQPFTAEVWYTPTAVNEGAYRRLVSKESSNGAGRQGWLIRLAPTGLPTARNISFQRYTDDSPDSATSTTLAAAGVRHHIVGTYDGTTMRLYVDGVLENSNGSNNALLDTAVPLRLAQRSNGSENAGGDIDDFSLYDRALSAAEIKAHYDAGT